MHHKLTLIAVLASSCVTAVAPAAAADGKAPAGSIPSAGMAVADSAPAGAPAGYVIVKSPQRVALTGRQTQGAAGCPTGKVVLGGGVIHQSTSLGVNLNDSY